MLVSTRSLRVNGLNFSDFTMQACHSKFVMLIFILGNLSISKYLNAWSNKETLNANNNLEKTERPYKLGKKYKDTIQNDIENMLE